MEIHELAARKGVSDKTIHNNEPVDELPIPR